MPAQHSPVRAFQWDLARQVERHDWLLQQLPRYADWGYQELYLHLEDAVEYPSLPGVARRDAYTYRQMERLVTAATRVGIGVVPIVNLEWIQKLIRDTSERGHSREAVTDSIVRSMDDYINFITPQFSRTHINFQRVPTVDTSNPFSAKVIPSLDESMLVIRFRGIKQVDFPYLLSMIDGAFMSRMNTIVVPGGKMGFAMELILRPLIQQLLETGKIT